MPLLRVNSAKDPAVTKKLLGGHPEPFERRFEVVLQGKLHEGSG